MPPAHSVGILKVGDTITVAERDYMYGTGTLWMRVTSVEPVQVVDGEREHWQTVHGLALRRDGSQLSDRPRYALVRLAAVRRGVQP